MTRIKVQEDQHKVLDVIDGDRTCTRASDRTSSKSFDARNDARALGQGSEGTRVSKLADAIFVIV